MTTPPPGPGGTAGTGDYDRAQASYLQRQMAEGFGAHAGRYDRARPAIDAYRAGCARVAGVLRQAGAFAEPEEWLSYWRRPYTRDEWLDLVPATGGFTRHPEAIHAELLHGLGAAVDAAGGTFTMCYTTITATAARLGS